MKNVIEQIRKIKGVTIVEEIEAGIAVVVFESMPKSLTPEELVDGGIYTSTDDGDRKFIMTYRFKSIRGQLGSYIQACYHSLINDPNKFSTNDWCCCMSKKRACRPATPSEAQSLIRAEIANNYFYELKDAK